MDGVEWRLLSTKQLQIQFALQVVELFCFHIHLPSSTCVKALCCVIFHTCSAHCFAWGRTKSDSVVSVNMSVFYISQVLLSSIVFLFFINADVAD